MRALLDTHAFVWLATDQARLGAGAVEVIRGCEEGLYISAVTPWEIGLLIKRGRLEFTRPPAKVIRAALRQHGIEEIPVSGEDALRSVELPEIHRDPFDRLLVELARRENLVLISKDAQLARYPGVRVVWD